MPSAAERVVRFRARSIALVMGVVLLFVLAIEIVLAAAQVITWIFIALFLALAINPLVEWIQRRGVRRRGTAVMVAYLTVLLAIAGVAAIFIPILVDQVNSFVDKVPEYVHDLTKGRGPLGFLETKYHIVERVEKAVNEGGAGKILGFSSVALSITRSVVSAVIAVITIAFMTLFMLLEGPAWVDRFYALLPPRAEKRWRAVGRDIYKTVGGYVAGNLLISLIAGTTSAIVLTALGVPYSVALGLLVAFLDLIPLAGATVAAIIVTTVAFLTGTLAGIVVLVFFVIYQQIENQVLQPIVYGKTVRLSPLAVLIAVLIGAAIGGILGALAAIPVAGTIQVVLVDVLEHRRQRAVVVTAHETRPVPESPG
ncbi:MAG: AI-2E family transporter [Gaiellaceae bacterium]